jgi:hypothetical protein
MSRTCLGKRAAMKAGRRDRSFVASIAGRIPLGKGGGQERPGTPIATEGPAVKRQVRTWPYIPRRNGPRALRSGPLPASPYRPAPPPQPADEGNYTGHVKHNKDQHLGPPLAEPGVHELHQTSMSVQHASPYTGPKHGDPQKRKSKDDALPQEAVSTRDPSKQGEGE